MSIDNLIKDGNLTDKGAALASRIRFNNCLQECYKCKKRNSQTNGPGGNGCPAEGELNNPAEMNFLLEKFGGMKVPF
jgi:hypothetical protein